MPHWTSGVHREVLPNGLTVLIQPVSGAPAVAVVTRVAAGFFDEPDEWVGISHVLEHMFFKGTPTRGVGAIARETKAAGGYLNAGTSYDYTAYYTVLPARGLNTAVAVQADALQHALIDPDELGRELRVIIEEAKRKLDTPGAVAQETLHQLLFDRHRIRRWRIGTEESLSRLTREDVAAYYRTRYVPTRTIVAIAGGVDHEAALALVHRHYAGWAPAPPAVDRSPDEPPRRDRRARTLRGDVRQAVTVFGWHTPPALHSDTIPLEVAAAVLASGRASRLYRAAREAGLVTSIGAWNFTPTEVGVFSVLAELDPARLRPALAAAAGEVVRLARDGPVLEELERARTLLRTQWARRFEAAEGRASELAAAEGLERVDLLEREYERLLGVTADEVRAAVERYLDPGAVAAVAYLPNDAPADLSVDWVAEAFEQPSPRAAARPVVAGPEPPPGRSVPDRRTGAVLHVPLPGTDLLLRERPGTPTVTIGLYRVRTAPDSAERAGLGALAVRSAVRGAGPFDGAALAEAFERLGGAVGASVTADWFGFATTVLAEHLAEAACLLRMVLREPRLVPDDVLIERGVLAEDARQLADDMYRRPLQLAFAAAFADHGYGVPVLGYPESVPSLEPEVVRDWHRRMMAEGRTTVVVAGEFDLDRTGSMLAGCFAGDPPSTRREIGLPGAAIAEGPRRRSEVRDKAQTAIAMLFLGPTRLAPDRHAAEVWAAWAGGLGGQLFEALRDRRSLAYTVLATPWQRRTAGALLTYIATSPEREEEAREAMLAELARCAERTPPVAEIEMAINYLVGQAEVSRQSASALAGEILDAWVHGTGLEELLDPAAPYRAVTPEAVREVAGRYLDPTRRTEGVVRGGGPLPSDE